MKTILMVGAGGFAGSVLRYLLTQFIQAKAAIAFPFGTLLVNLTGCFAIGLILGAGARGIINNDWRLFLAVGVCGGFTTFSAFSFETIALLRSGQLLYAFTYILLSVVTGLLATFAALTITEVV